MFWKKSKNTPKTYSPFFKDNKQESFVSDICIGKRFYETQLFLIENFGHLYKIN